MAPTPFNRLGFILSLSSTGALVACNQGTTSPPNAVLPQPCFTLLPTSQQVARAAKSALIPLNIDLTQTDLSANTAVYAAVTGQTGQGASGNVVIYRCDSSGNPTKVAVADNIMPPMHAFQGECYYDQTAFNNIISPNYTLPSFAKGWADYSFPLTTGTVNNTFDLANITKGIPGLGPGLAAFSGRIWISIGPLKLPFVVQSGSSLVTPSLTGNPGQYCLFDWIEFSWDGRTFNGNTTQVNQYGFTLLLQGTPGGALQGVLNKSRPAIFTDMTNGSAPIFGANNVLTVPVSPADLAPQPGAPTGTQPLYPTGITNLRALPPITVSPLGPGPLGPNVNVANLNTYFNSLLSALYNTWVTTPVVLRWTSNEVWTGLVLTYQQNAQPPSGGPAPATQPGMPGPTPAPGTTALAFYQGNFSSLTAFQNAVQLSQNPVAAGSPAFSKPGVPSSSNLPMFWITGAILGNAGAPPPTPQGWQTISSFDVWQNAGSLANPTTVSPTWPPDVDGKKSTDIVLAIQNGLATALNRGLFAPGQPSYLFDFSSVSSCPNPSTYYPASPVSNLWARAWHKDYSQNKLAYAFPYDDNCSQNPSISVPASSITITLGKFFS